MDKSLERMQQTYNEIEIPKELSSFVRKGIEQGKSHRRKHSMTRRTLKWGGSAAAALLISLTVSVNTMPAFAENLEQVPVLGKLVEVLQFTHGSAKGGTVTDGVDVHFITVKPQGDRDQLIMNFAREGEEQSLASAYQVQFTEYPNTMTFTVNGARAFSAAKDLAALKQSRFVKDAYPLLTMDDSAIRFNVILDGPVTYEVKEYKDPAQVVVTLMAGGEKQEQPVYALRTSSQPAGESLGLMEEILYGTAGLRVLKDREGLFVVEAGYYSSEAAAREKLKAIQTELGDQVSLLVEKRGPGEQPASIPAAREGH